MTGSWQYEPQTEATARKLADFDATAQRGREQLLSPPPDDSFLGKVGGAFAALDKPLSERAGISIPDLPGPIDEIGNFLLREGTRPTNLALAALGSPEVIAPLRASGIAGRIAASAIAPVVEGGFATRLAGTAAVNAAARTASEATASALPDDAPWWVRAGAGLAGGVVGGVGATAGIAGLRGVVAAGERAAADIPADLADSAVARYRANGGTNEDITQALENARLSHEADRPNAAARTFYELPGTTSAVRPEINVRDYITESNIASTQQSAQASQHMFATRSPLMKAIDAAFGEGTSTGTPVGVQFRGSAESAAYPGTGTAADVLENPGLYDLTPEQSALVDAYQGRNEVHRTAANALGADIKEFRPETGGAYVPNSDLSPMREARQQNLEAATARTGSTTSAERVYQTGRDRWAHDQRLVASGDLPPDQAFVPNTNLEQLTEQADASKAAAIRTAVLREGLGGKTLPQVVADVAPGVIDARDSLQQQVQAVSDKVQRAQAAITTNSALASRFEQASTRTAGRADTLLGQIENATQDPVIDRIVGGIDELDRAGRGLDAVAQTAAGRVALRGHDLESLTTELADLKTKLAGVQDAYASVNPRDYVRVPEAGNKYFPSSDAGDIQRLMRKDTSPITRTLGAINATVLGGGDLSPIVGQQGQVQWLTAPIQTSQMIAHALKSGWDDGDLLRGFRKDYLAEQIGADPERWSAFARATGRAFTPGTTPEEFNGGWFRKLPFEMGDKFAKWNDGIYSAVVQGQKSVFDDTVQTLLKQGLPQAEAEAVAGQHVMELIPTPNAAGAGLSPHQAALLRTPLTSITFVQRPLQMITDAGEALVKTVMGNGDTILPRQRLALNSSLKMAGSMLGLAASTSAIEALRTGRDPVQASLDAINPDPKNSKFLQVTLPGGFKVPLGGPYRGLIRAIAPGEVKLSGHDAPIWVPFAGAPQYFQNRISPALRVGVDLIKNKDFYNDPIMTGDFPLNVFQAAEYAGEGVLPLTASAPIQSARAHQTPLEGTTNVVGNFLGTNINVQSPTDQLNDFSTKRFGANFYDLEPRQQALIKQDHPDVWAQAIQHGSTNRQLGDAVRTDLKSQQSASDQQLLGGQLAVQDWKKQRADRNVALQARLTQIYGDSPISAATAAKDPTAKFVQAIQQNTDTATGAVNWDNVDAARAHFTDEENAYIDRNTGANDTPVQHLYRELAQQYYSLPKYVGYSAAQANAIDDAYQNVRNFAAQHLQPGESPDESQMALAYVHALPPDIDLTVAQGVRRRITGLLTESTQRARFKARTPSLVLVTGQGALTPRDVAAIQAAIATPAP